MRFLDVRSSGLLACLAAAALFALGAGPRAYAAAYDSPTPMVMAQAQTKAETLAAVGKSGEKVCRLVPVGIAVHDRIRGEVKAVDADRVTVRIDDPGRHPHMIGDRLLVKGMSVESAAAEWTPCLE